MRRRLLTIVLAAAAHGPTPVAAGPPAEAPWETVVLIEVEPFELPATVGQVSKATAIHQNPALTTGSVTPPSEQKTKPGGSLEPRPDAPKGLEQSPPGPDASAAPKAPSVQVDKPASLGLAQKYCINIADAAADARVAWQKKTIAQIEQDLQDRTARLEAATAEYQQWLARRDEFLKKAQGHLAGIFNRMRPDSAALQLAAMDEETAAAVLMQLDQRKASAVLAEMEPAQAARLTTTLSGAARVAPGPAPKLAPDGRKS